MPDEAHRLRCRPYTFLIRSLVVECRAEDTQAPPGALIGHNICSNNPSLANLALLSDVRQR